MTKMIGITGLMGSGKSTLMNQLKGVLDNSKYEFIDVDIYRRKLIKEEAFRDNFSRIDTNNLNRTIYKDPELMSKFKELLYANLFGDIKQINKTIILEWALLIDDELKDYFDYIFILDCSVDIILDRLGDGDLGSAEVKRRIDLQLSTEEKISKLTDNYMVINAEKELDIRSIIEKIDEVCYEV